MNLRGIGNDNAKCLQYYLAVKVVQVRNTAPTIGRKIHRSTGARQGAESCWKNFFLLPNFCPKMQNLESKILKQKLKFWAALISPVRNLPLPIRELQLLLLIHDAVAANVFNPNSDANQTTTLSTESGHTG